MTHIDNKRRKELDLLLERFLEIPGHERDKFLMESTRHDPTLADDLKILIQHTDEAESFIGDTVFDFLNPLAPLFEGLESPAEFIFEKDSEVGRYRIISLLGKGGMGHVYLAERSDGVFKKEVALKCIKKGMDSEEILQRFRNERQILATLQHPNIASLIDGGMADDGRPYLVMEYVDGKPVTNWCDDNQLDIRRRCELFVRVSRAIAHAHRHLVVHRDLKPANILVTEEGEVKLLDFGIARILDPEALGLTAPVTQTHFRLMTPDYAAPEQLSGDAITTSVDVYALGVILHELLCGMRPKNRSRDSLYRASRAFMQSENRDQLAENRSSTAKGLYHKLASELDLILMRAMHPDPGHRYATPDELADDLQRYLDGNPVLARKDSYAYRLKKLMLRNKSASITAAVFAITVIALLYLLTAQYFITQFERDQAVKERDIAEAVTDVFRGMFAANDPFSLRTFNPDTLTVKDFVLLSKYEILTGLDQAPEVKVRLLATYSHVLNNVDNVSEAITLLDEALSITESHAETAHLKPVILVELANSWWRRRDADRAFAYVTDAIEILRLGDSKDDEELHKALFFKSVLFAEMNDFDKALELQLQVESFYRQRGDSLSAEAGKLFNSLAITHERLGSYSDALDYYEKSLQARRHSFGDNHPTVAFLYVNMAPIYINLKEMDKAESILISALEIFDRYLSEDHSTRITALRLLANIYRDSGRFSESLAILDKLIELYNQNPDANIRSLSIIYHSYVTLLQRMGRLQEAEEMARLNVELSGKVMGDPLSGLVPRNALADVLYRQNRHQEAASLYEQVLEGFAKVLPPGNIRFAGTLMNLGSSYTYLDQPDKALANWLKAHEIYQNVFGSDHPSTRGSASVIAKYYEEAGESEMAATFRLASGIPEE
jgi:eukaryotic-like serine/threonine-protein kinase